MLQINELNLVADGPIIPAEEFQAVLDAEGIIKQAEARAAAILEAAEQKYAERKRDGYEDGLREGRLEMAEKMMDTVASSVDYLSSLEAKVVQIVGKCLKKVLGKIPQEDRVTSVVRNALAVTRNESKVTIRVCPADVETIQSRLSEIMKPYRGLNFVDVVPDSRLTTDGCVLETDIGVVDASLDTQLEAIEKSLARSMTSESL